jgi:hypothetical protein
VLDHGSCGGKRDTDKLRASFTVFETVRYDTKGKSLNLCLGFLRGASISEDAREVNDFGNPAAVFLLFNFHAEVHMRDVTPFRST